MADLFKRFRRAAATDAAPTDVSDEVAHYKAAFAKIEEVCRRASEGDLEARIVGVAGFEDVAGVFVAINRMLDLTDAFVRESGASLEAASQGRYHRRFLLRGMAGAFGLGANTINRARESMQDLEKEAAAMRSRLADELEASVSRVVEAVSASASELEATARDMTDAAETTHRQCMAVASATEEATASTQTVAASAEELTAAIAEISRQVAQSTSATQRVVEEVMRTGDAVRELGAAARKVDTVVEFIGNMASQTNLLALNATIEAARAGTAGKGFAVVASEVKSLASQTASATKDIVAQVQAIQGASRQTTSAVESINTETSRVSEISTTIASAVEEQSAATGEISGNIQQAAEGIQEVSRNVTGIRDATERTGTAARNVLDSAGVLTRHATELRSEVAQFVDRVRAG